MVVEGPQLVNLRSIRPGLHPRPFDVLPILAATRIGSKRRGDESQGATDPVCPHLTQSAGEHGIPIPVSPVDRKRWTLHLELPLNGRDQSTVLVIDGALASEVVVVLRHLKH